MVQTKRDGNGLMEGYITTIERRTGSYLQKCSTNLQKAIRATRFISDGLEWLIL
jgi:hypothetical protein